MDHIWPFSLTFIVVLTLCILAILFIFQFNEISSFRQCRNKLNMFNLFRLCRKDEISFDIVAETGNIVAKNGNDVEATFDIVEKRKFYNRIVRHCCRLWQQVECCFDKVERCIDNDACCFDIVAGVDGALQSCLCLCSRFTTQTTSGDFLLMRSQYGSRLFEV